MIRIRWTGTRSARYWLVSLFVCGLVGVMPQMAHGQWAQGRMTPAEGILLKPPREVEVLLEDAREAIGKKQWSEATLALGMLLGIEAGEERDSGEDYFLVRENGDDVLVDGTVLGEAHALMASMPEEGRKVIELRYGVRAAQALDAAIEKADWNSVRELAGKYAFTEAGQDAGIVLAERMLSEGQPRSAAVTLERLLSMESARRRFGPTLGWMAAASWQAAGSKSQALAALTKTRDAFVAASFAWNGTKIEWDANSTNEALLDRIRTQGISAVTRKVAYPAIPGGDAARNADTKAGLPLPILRWVVQLHESSQHKENLDRTLNKLARERKSNLIPSRIPIAVGSMVITPTYDRRILAVDAREGKGKIRWACVFSGTPLGFSLDRFAGKDGFSLLQPAPDYLVRRVWGEMAEGQISSDGKLVFSLSELPALDVGESFAQGPNARLARNAGPKAFNVLQAWSIQDEGKLVWECGGPTGLNAPELAGALFLGVPLPHEGELLSIAELNGELYLLGIDNGTGQLRWRQPLAANAGATISIDPQRRSYGAAPAVDGSVVVCPTLSGHLIAYDLASRELLWQFKYPINASQTPGAAFNFIGNMETRNSEPLMPRSVDNSVLLHDGVAVFAPPNGMAVFGISLADGKELWQIGYDDPTQLRYVAGAVGNVVGIVQEGSILGVDLHTGQRAWPKIDFLSGESVVGRGVRSGTKYYVPLQSQTILEVDLIRGAITGQAKVEKPLGNLVAVGDRLISASPFQLDCYSILDAFQKRLVEELKGEGETAVTWMQQGELALANGDLDASLGYLEKAYKAAPGNAQVRLSLLKVAMQALKTDFGRYANRIQMYDDLPQVIDLPSYLRIIIHGLEEQERWEEMFAKLLEYSDVRLSRRIDQMSDGENIELQDRRTVQEDRWLASQLERCASKLSAEAKARMMAEVKKRVAVPYRDFGLRRLRLEHFQGLGGMDEERIEIAKALMPSQLIDAERILQFRPGKEATAPALRDALIGVYLSAGRVGLAMENAGEDVDALMRTREKIVAEPRSPLRLNLDAAQVRSAAEFHQELKKPHTWPGGELQVGHRFGQELQRDLGNSADSSVLCQMVESEGDAFGDWQVYFGAGSLQYVHRKTRDSFQQLIDVGTSEVGTVPRLYAVDSMLLVELKNQLVAVDTLKAFQTPQDGQLWRTSYVEETGGQESGRLRVSTILRDVWGLPINRRSFKVAAASRRGIVVLSNDDLTCLDLLTGARLWSLSGFLGASFVRDGDTLYAFRPYSNSSPNASHTPNKPSDPKTFGECRLDAIDLRDGSHQRCELDRMLDWDVLAVIGGKFLLQPVVPKSEERTNGMKLKLLDPKTGKVELSREHVADTRLALVGDTGVIAMRSSGEMHYWNALRGTEHTHQVDVEGKFGSVSAQLFGDVALVLPFAGSMELEGATVGPSQRTDPSVANCAGKMFAISVDDGSMLWNRSQRVRHFMFPLSQSRESPVAVFLRRVSITKVKGMDLDFAGLALVDIKTGRLMYQKHDSPAERGAPFRQQLLPNRNMMVLGYLGNTWTVLWTDQEAGLAPLDQVDEIGDMDMKEFRKMAEGLVDEIQSNLLPKSRPGLVEEPK
ncbi:MAG: PQQ-binding-like beta-propeller repeat protein [Pirellula sp.]